MKRIFVAINLPEDIKQELAGMQKEIIDMYPENSGMNVAKWVKKDNLHVTMLFIGEAEDSVVFTANQALKGVASNYGPISINFNKVCYGPFGKVTPRLVWVHVEKNPMLYNLSKDIKSKMLEKNILKTPDNRPFQGHITLGRIREWQWKRINPEERPDIEQNIDLSFKAASIELMESQLRREGSEYSVIESVGLIK